MHTNKNSQQLPIAAPDIIRAFQKDYPNIDYELLLGDYTELEEWVKSGRVWTALSCVCPPARGHSRQ